MYISISISVRPLIHNPFIITSSMFKPISSGLLNTFFHRRIVHRDSRNIFLELFNPQERFFAVFGISRTIHHKKERLKVISVSIPQSFQIIPMHNCSILVSNQIDSLFPVSGFPASCNRILFSVTAKVYIIFSLQ